MPFFSHKQTHNPVPKTAILPLQKLEKLLGETTPANAAKPLSAGALEARRLIAEAQKKFEQQQKEKQMPDIKTALEKVIDEWSSDDKPTAPTPAPVTQPPIESTMPKQYFKETVGTSKATFNFVRDNPYMSVKETIEGLTKAGYNPASTTSLISQMVRQGLISRDKDNRLTALRKEYTPLKNAALATMRKVNFQKESAAKMPPAPPAPQATEGIAALNAIHAQAAAKTVVVPLSAAAPVALTAKQVMETLSVKEARALYLELKEMFGG